MNVSRRAFLSRGSVGVAIAGGLALVPALSTALKTQPKAAPLEFPNGAPEPLVAHIRDLTSGEMSLMVGTDRVVLRDVDLASRLYAAARRP